MMKVVKKENVCVPTLYTLCNCVCIKCGICLLICPSHVVCSDSWRSAKRSAVSLFAHKCTVIDCDTIPNGQSLYLPSHKGRHFFLYFMRRTTKITKSTNRTEEIAATMIMLIGGSWITPSDKNKGTWVINMRQDIYTVHFFVWLCLFLNVFIFLIFLLLYSKNDIKLKIYTMYN